MIIFGKPNNIRIRIRSSKHYSLTSVSERYNSTNYPLGTAIWNSHIKQSYTHRTPKKGSRSQTNKILPYFGQFFVVANLRNIWNAFTGLNNALLAQNWKTSGRVPHSDCIVEFTYVNLMWFEMYISLTLKMPEINGAKTQWNKQNVIRLVLIAGIKFKYPNWGRKLLHMNSTISYFSRGCSPSVKVTICLGNFLSTRFWAEHSLNAFPLGQEDSVTMLQATQLKVCLKTEDLAWTHYISYDGHPS